MKTLHYFLSSLLLAVCLRAQVAPTISSQPQSQIAAVGGSATLAVVAAGSSPLSYQWRKGTTSIAGATNSSYTLTAYPEAAGSYSVIVSNSAGSVTSAAATLGVVVTQPVARTVTPGAKSTLYVVATTGGGAALSYQWWKDGVPVSGATSAVLALENFAAANAGNYYCVLGLSGAPTWPTTTVPVTLGAAAPANYALFANPTNYARLTQKVYLLAGRTYSFQARVLSPSGFTLPNNAIPEFLNASGGYEDFTGRVVVQSAPALYSVGGQTVVQATYQALVDIELTLQMALWCQSGFRLTDVRLVDGTTTRDIINNGSFDRGTDFWNFGVDPFVTLGTSFVASTWAGGSGNNGAAYTLPAPEFFGSSQPSYQWRKNGVAIAGATNASFTIASLSLADGGSYDVVATNAAGSATSNAATLTVNYAPTIIFQPTILQTLLAGQSATFTVAANGTPTPTYQWRKNGSAIAGAIGASYTIAGVQNADAGTYDVVVSNAVGSVTSMASTLAIATPTAPVISTQPRSATYVVGTNVPLSVVASSSVTASYQWRFNGTAIAGATASTFTVYNAQLANAGSYDVIVTNSAGSVTSQAAGIVIEPAAIPSIISQPASTSAAVGGSVTFTVSGVGSPGPWYQWRKNGVAIYGATGASYTIAVLQAADAGSYDCVLTNMVGATTSAAAVLTITPAIAPSITAQPVGGVLNETNVVSFAVTASGSAPLNYQWRKGGVAITGAVSSTIILGPAVPSDAGAYDVVVSNAGGTVTSASAVLTVVPVGVSIVSQPSSLTTSVGLAATFSVVANGSPVSPSYQWRKGGIAIAGATNSALTFSSPQSADSGYYDVVVSNSFATVTSASVTLGVVDSAPQITAQPTGGTLSVGGSLTLAVTATGSRPLTYQWRRDGVALSGATAASLAITNAQTYQTGDYTVVVTNALGNVTSAAARVTVRPQVVSYSARLYLDYDGAIGTFTIEGTQAKKVLLRAVGPGLVSFGLSGLSDPKLELFDSAGTLLAANDDWSTSADAASLVSTAAAVGAFALPAGSRDAAIVRTLSPGTYTARALPATGAAGVGYLELYDADLATGAMSSLPYVAVRGRMGAGGGVVVGGLGSNGRGQRSYLLRAVGPTLAVAGAMANPSMLIVRDSTLVGSNDDWDANAAEGSATTTATNRVAAFALPAGSRDAAQVLTGNLHVGACTVQVSSGDGQGGVVLVELHDLDASRPASLPPTIASQPVSLSAAVGETATLRVIASGTAPLAYQWRKDGVPVAGATNATYSLAALQASQGGSYSVAVSNTLGTVTSLPVTLTVQGTATGASAVQAVVGGYVPGGTVTVTNTLTFSGTATSLGWTANLPAGWSYVSDAGAVGDIKPAVGDTGALNWAWSTVPASPVVFSYTIKAPTIGSGDQQLAASGIVRVNGTLSQPVATPNPLVIKQVTYHSADTNSDFRVSLLELTRVIELYNTRNGTTRTGAYAVSTAMTEDGFEIDATRAPTAGVSLARYHAADSNQDGKLSLLELTRVIELYNYRSGTSRTGQYHPQSGTEDGFAPGP